MPVYDCHLPKGLIIETAIYVRKITIGVISHASSQKKPAISYPISKHSLSEDHSNAPFYEACTETLNHFGSYCIERDDLVPAGVSMIAK